MLGSCRRTWATLWRKLAMSQLRCLRFSVPTSSETSLCYSGWARRRIWSLTTSSPMTGRAAISSGRISRAWRRTRSPSRVRMRWLGYVRTSSECLGIIDHVPVVSYLAGTQGGGNWTFLYRIEQREEVLSQLTQHALVQRHCGICSSLIAPNGKNCAAEC